MHTNVDSKSELCYDKYTKGQSSEMQAGEEDKRKERGQTKWYSWNRLKNLFKLMCSLGGLLSILMVNQPTFWRAEMFPDQFK